MSLADLRAALDRLPRLPLSHRPTPFESVPRFSKALGGPTVWLKRDDCTGLALGGNKTRHNEFIFGEAVQRGADTVVWGAGVQSNNCRQTVATCAKAGLACHLVLSTHGTTEEPVAQGNLLLDLLMGAEVEFVPEQIGPALNDRMEVVAERFRSEGRRVFCWTDPGVLPLAAVGYVECLVEVVEQAEQAGVRIDAVYVSSAGSTGAGLALAAKAMGVAFPVINVCPMDWPWDTRASIADIANRAAERLGIETRLTPEDVTLTFDHIAPGYGKVSAGSLEAIRLLGRTEGVLLDPIYSGKAAAGMIADIRAGRFGADRNVALVHTGGTPALFAYAEELATI